MTKVLIMALFFIAALPPAEAAPYGQDLTEADVWVLSNAQYADILEGAREKGLNYPPDQIASGYKRHHEEYRLRLINNGYKIVGSQVDL